MILSLFRKDRLDEPASALFLTASEQARAPAFYAECGVPDTPEGRFEALALHVYLLLRRLKGEGEAADRLAQKVFDLFFARLDDGLRELGVGDLVVGKKIRSMAGAFYGRVGAFEAALADGAEAGALQAALSRNLYEQESAPGAAAIADYVRAAARLLAEQPTPRLLHGLVRFPDPPAGKGPSQ